MSLRPGRGNSALTLPIIIGERILRETTNGRVADSPDLTVIVDFRERSSGICDILSESELLEVREAHLEIGDYVIRDLAVERKTASDLKTSLEDGRLFRQLVAMRRSFRRRLLIIEGPFDPLSLGSAQAARGVFAKITAGMQIPVIFTRDVRDTARFLERVAIQIFGLVPPYIVRADKSGNQDLSFQQSFLLIGIPGIGVQRARKLLAHFGSIRGVFSASPADIQRVAGLSNAKVALMQSIINSTFKSATDAPET